MIIWSFVGKISKHISRFFKETVSVISSEVQFRFTPVTLERSSVVNLNWASFNGRSLEITLTVPLKGVTGKER